MLFHISAHLKGNNHHAWALTLIYLAGIFYVSSMPVSPQPIKIDELSWIITTAEHIIEYAVLGFLVYHGLTGIRNERVRKNAIYLTLAAGLLYGISDEIHQSFVPGRDASVIDVLADLIGTGAGIIIGRHAYGKHAAKQDSFYSHTT